MTFERRSGSLVQTRLNCKRMHGENVTECDPRHSVVRSDVPWVSGARPLRWNLANAAHNEQMHQAGMT